MRRTRSGHDGQTPLGGTEPDGAGEAREVGEQVPDHRLGARVDGEHQDDGAGPEGASTGWATAWSTTACGLCATFAMAVLPGLPSMLEPTGTMWPLLGSRRA